MSIYKTADIDTEDGPALGAPRTREDWDALFATLAVADNIGRGVPVVVDWGALAFEPERSFGDGFIDVKTCRGNRPDAQEIAQRVFAAHLFPPPADLNEIVVALEADESRLTRASWGSMRLADPVIRAALEECKRAENMRGVFPHYPYACPSCAVAGQAAPFEWAGALFVHLITCSHFAKGARE